MQFACLAVEYIECLHTNTVYTHTHSNILVRHMKCYLKFFLKDCTSGAHTFIFVHLLNYMYLQHIPHFIYTVYYGIYFLLATNYPIRI